MTDFFVYMVKIISLINFSYLKIFGPVRNCLYLS